MVFTNLQSNKGKVEFLIVKRTWFLILKNTNKMKLIMKGNMKIPYYQTCSLRKNKLLKIFGTQI